VKNWLCESIYVWDNAEWKRLPRDRRIRKQSPDFTFVRIEEELIGFSPRSAVWLIKQHIPQLPPPSMPSPTSSTSTQSSPIPPPPPRVGILGFNPV